MPRKTQQAPPPEMTLDMFVALIAETFTLGALNCFIGKLIRAYLAKRVTEQKEQGFYLHMKG